MEIIVVDNASTDGSREAVEKRFPQVKLIHNTANVGFAKANNIGIGKSTGRYVCIVNSDVKVIGDCMEAMMSYLDGHPRIAVLGPRIVGANGLTQRSCMELPTLSNTLWRAIALDKVFAKSSLFRSYLMVDGTSDTVTNVDVINGCFWMVRRSAIDQVGELDEQFFMYGEDIDWCQRFRKEGWDIVFFPRAQAIHYGGASSARAPLKYYIEMQKANLQYWRKHHGVLSSLCYMTIVMLHHSIRVVGFSLASLFINKDDDRYYKIRRSLASIKWMFGMRHEDETVHTING
jgi:GT2 family glycosyltransferase